MRMTMKVEFSKAEVLALCEAEVVRRFGPPASGFRLSSSGSVFGVEVETVEGDPLDLPVVDPLPEVPESPAQKPTIIDRLAGLVDADDKPVVPGF